MSGQGFWQSPTTGAGVLDWVSVIDHGAVGDGVTDDTAAIQAAVDATPAGGACYFPVPADEYLIAATVTVPHGMRLVGDQSFAGRHTRIHMSTANTTAFAGPTFVADYEASYWAIDGLEILGPIGGQSSGAGVYSTTSVQLSRCFIHGFYDGVHLYSTGASEPIFYSMLRESIFDQATHAGVRLDGVANNFTWLGCRANDNAWGLQLVGAALSVRLLGGAFDRNDIAVHIDAGPVAVLLSGLYIEGEAASTDMLIGNTATVSSVRVESCYFNYKASGWHIDAANVNGLTIDACEFRGPSSVRVAAPGTNVLWGQNRNAGGGTITLPAGTVRLDASSVVPEPVGVASAAGTSHYLARADHVHEAPEVTPITADDVRDAGRWEVVVTGNPATAVTTPDGTDWVYGWITG